MDEVIREASVTRWEKLGQSRDEAEVIDAEEQTAPRRTLVAASSRRSPPSSTAAIFREE